MSSAQPERYAPRRIEYVGLRQSAVGPIRLSTINPHKHPIPESILAAADKLIASSRPSDTLTPLGAGFAVLHHGQDSNWLLIHHWVDGGIASRELYFAPLDFEGGFAIADANLFACVWELEVIAAERNRWVQTAMSGWTVDDYLSAK